MANVFPPLSNTRKLTEMGHFLYFIMKKQRTGPRDMRQLTVCVSSGLSWRGQPPPAAQTPAPLPWVSVLGTLGTNSINLLSWLCAARQSVWSTSLGPSRLTAAAVSTHSITFSSSFRLYKRSPGSSGGKRLVTTHTARSPETWA